MRSRDFKLTARDALKGHWFIAVIAGFIASLLGGTAISSGGFSINLDFGNNQIENETNGFLPVTSVPDGNYAGVLNILISIFAVALIAALIYSVIQLIIGSAVGVGYAQFNIDMIDGNQAKIGTMFSCFDQIKTAICAKLLIFVRVFIGMIFFIIPGIVMAYSYAMVNFVMAENPELNAREALKESKRIMKGNRWRLFCLEISFIGWMILSAFALGIPLLWVVPYQQAAFAAFYREVRDNA